MFTLISLHFKVIASLFVELLLLTTKHRLNPYEYRNFKEAMLLTNLNLQRARSIDLSAGVVHLHGVGVSMHISLSMRRIARNLYQRYTLSNMIQAVLFRVNCDEKSHNEGAKKDT